MCWSTRGAQGSRRQVTCSSMCASFSFLLLLKYLGQVSSKINNDKVKVRKIHSTSTLTTSTTTVTIVMTVTLTTSSTSTVAQTRE